MSREGISRRTVLKYTGGAVGAAGLTGTATAADRVEVNVGFANARGRRAALEAATSVKREFSFGALTVTVPREAVDGLAADRNVRYVEENGEMYAFDQTTPYGIEITDADVAIDGGNTGDGVSIAILDTGIDAQHETLEENLGEGWATDDAACTTDCGGGPFGGNDIDECLEEWDDDNDHGSHCAGTAAAADNGEGVLGVAPDATLHAVKVLDCEGSGSFDDIAAGIEWSADQGHEVQSMSLGADSDSDVVSDAIDYAVERNVVLVAAAGNDGECTDCVGFPARHEEVIAVSATDENDDLASFSSTGPEVELAAPGVGVLSTVPRDDYAEFDGTSMACPHVSGAAATVIADGTTDREAVRAELKQAADDIGLDDNEQGAGRLNVADAVDADEDDDDDDDGDEEIVSVVTNEATDVGETSATLNGEVTELENADEADVGFEYGETGGDLANTADAGTLSSTGTFDATVEDLASGTEYEFRAIAETAGGSDEGDVLTFVTEDEEETENTAPVIDSWDVSTRTTGPWSRAESVWEVSDDDGNLESVTTELLEGGSVVAEETSTVSGSSASGEHEVRTRGDADEVRLVVTDEEGETTSATENF
ncbi:Subtilisin-like serine protease [Halalkaliarchaeum sp. AArc-CO]|uniref:S8 family serine peptidase n=1 Tax=unclassified Halalkaliarchaeum TaxID=2678344 RepID=UPI00217CF857|nr:MULTISPECIES: S8 family serine peptidase [unclassified Halalkaliarchaeum]MDR5672017.1 S8 family serine peptidase [Halalkaliarchaeum sp. AArc-GB]UWG51522.1 Subtilisin-like serine protease [Halalkaliarchaeum sp. AArc-CO]